MVSIAKQRRMVRRNREELGGNKVINVFPSKEYQKYMETSLYTFLPMQMATLAFQYMKKRRFSRFLRELRKHCYFTEERGFLRSASHDVIRHSFKRAGFSEKTERLYKQMCKAVSWYNPQRAMFLECCRLPCIVDRKDIVSFRIGKEKIRYGIVCHRPHYSDKDFDLSDEFIHVYDLSERPIIEDGHIQNNDIFLLPPDMTKVPESHLPFKYRENYEKYKNLLTTEE